MADVAKDDKHVEDGVYVGYLLLLSFQGVVGCFCKCIYFWIKTLLFALILSIVETEIRLRLGKLQLTQEREQR